MNLRHKPVEHSAANWPSDRLLGDGGQHSQFDGMRKPYGLGAILFWGARIMKTVFGLLAALSIAWAGQARAEDTLSAATDSGPVVGSQDQGVRQWLGIPYAAAPVGPLRWQPPRRPVPWTSPKLTKSYGPECAQNAELGVFGKAGGSEDCLYLNVFSPAEAGAGAKPLPVFVWIYGGSLLVGAADDYDPRRLAREGKATVVTFNYRTGLLGFFAHPDLARRGTPTGNYGLMDQQFALDWVQRNIAQFDGDPSNVTIAGESSGGMSVYAQMVSPGSAGKFQTGIAMSGSALALKYPRFGSSVPLSDALAKGEAFAKAMKCDTQVLDCLRRLTTAEILAAQGPYTIVRPIIDGQFLPVDFPDAFKTGRFNKIRLIQGSTRDEARFFVGLGENGGAAAMTADDYPKILAGYFGKELAPAVEREYDLAQFENPSEAYAAAVTDYFFSCPDLAIARWIGAKAPVFDYEFADRTAPAYLKPTSYPQAASHTYELPYLFPGFHGGAGQPVALNSPQDRLASAMITLWTHARDIGNSASGWTPYDPDRDNVLRLSLPAPAMTSGRYRLTHHCDFWDRSGAY